MEFLQHTSSDETAAESCGRKQQNVSSSSQTKLLMQDVKNHQLQELHCAAFYNLALLSNPAWFDSDQYSLSRTAVSLWVVYHRTRIAESKMTVAQVIGEARGVIPNSRLVKYGNFRYDEKSEEMYITVDDFKDESNEREINSTKSQWTANNFSDTEASNTKHENLNLSSYFCSSYSRKNTQMELDDGSLNEWLKKVKNLLIAIQQVVGHALLDAWTDLLMKTSLRFVHATRTNPALKKLMNSDIRFITDYEQLLTEPVSKLEVQSIPHPCAVGTDLDHSSVNAQWQKLSSSQIRKIWKTAPGSKLQHTIEQEFKNEKLRSLIWINFLRGKKEKRFDCLGQTIEISENTAIELLGSSLLLAMNESPTESKKTPRPVETKSVPKNFFPEAHGEWIKGLFPHRLESVQPSKEIPPCRPTFCGPQISNSFPSVRPDQTGNVALPLRYFMTVPPPPLQSGMYIAPPRLPYTVCQQRNGMILVPANKLMNQVPQQVQFKVATAPPSYIPSPVYTSVPPATYASLSLPRPNWNNALRMNVPLQTTTALQYSRVNASRMLYQPISRELADHQKFDMKTDSSSDSSVRRNDMMNTRNDNYATENAEKKIANANPWIPCKNLMHPSSYSDSGYPMRLQQNTSNTILAPLMYEKGVQRPLPIYTMKSNPSLPFHDSTIPLKASPLINYKFQSPILCHTSSPKPQAFPQTSMKPMFMTAVAYNTMKRNQNRILIRKHKDTETYDNSYQGTRKSLSLEYLPFYGKDSLNYEDKVEKWLETVNQYTKKRANLSESQCSTEASKLDLSCDSNEIAVKEKNISLILKECGKNNALLSSQVAYSTTDSPKLKDPNKKMSTYNSSNIPKKLKKNFRKIYEKHLLSFKSSVYKLKKRKYIGDKVEILEHFFGEINSKCNRRYHRNGSKYLKTDRRFTKTKSINSSSKQGKFSVTQAVYRNLETNPVNQKFSAENYLIKIQNTFLPTNVSNVFETSTHKSQESNTFPSKRFKLSKSTSMFCPMESLERNQLTKKISSVSYLDLVADELFFSKKYKNLKMGEKLSQRPNTSDYDFTNGWDHFKLIIKILLQNVALSLEEHNIQTELASSMLLR